MTVSFSNSIIPTLKPDEGVKEKERSMPLIKKPN